MTATARIADRPWADGIAVYLMRRSDTVTLIERPGTPGTTEVVEPATDPGPSVTLDDDMAVALLDALARHYRRATDTGTLRADYEHERGRVDKAIGALTEVLAATVRNEQARLAHLTSEVSS